MFKDVDVRFYCGNLVEWVEPDLLVVVGREIRSCRKYFSLASWPSEVKFVFLEYLLSCMHWIRFSPMSRVT